MPVTSHAASSQPGLPMLRAMSAETMKIPEPIIDPTTTIVESYRPRPRWNSVSRVVAPAVADGLDITRSCIKMLQLIMNRDDAWALLTEYTKGESLLKHAMAVEASVRGYARTFGENENDWGIVALLHDFDY